MHGYVQCDQLGLFPIGLGNRKFCYKSSPKYCATFRAILKVTFKENSAAAICFWAKFVYIWFEHLVTLATVSYATVLLCNGADSNIWPATITNAMTSKKEFCSIGPWSFGLRLCEEENVVNPPDLFHVLVGLGGNNLVTIEPNIRKVD